LGAQQGKILGKIQNIGYPIGAGETLGAHHKDPGDAQHGVEDLGEVLQKCHNHAAFAVAGVDPESAQQHGKGQSQIQRQSCHGVGDRGDHACPEAGGG